MRQVLTRIARLHHINAELNFQALPHTLADYNTYSDAGFN